MRGVYVRQCFSVQCRSRCAEEDNLRRCVMITAPAVVLYHCEKLWVFVSRSTQLHASPLPLWITNTVCATLNCRSQSLSRHTYKLDAYKQHYLLYRGACHYHKVVAVSRRSQFVLCDWQSFQKSFLDIMISQGLFNSPTNGPVACLLFYYHFLLKPKVDGQHYYLP